MAVVYAFLADGLEEVECLATADVLIRSENHRNRCYLWAKDKSIRYDERV